MSSQETTSTTKSAPANPLDAHLPLREFLPTFSWLLFMVIPYLAMAVTFSPVAFWPQTISITIFLIAFTVTDYFVALDHLQKSLRSLHWQKIRDRAVGLAAASGAPIAGSGASSTSSGASASGGASALSAAAKSRAEKESWQLRGWLIFATFLALFPQLVHLSLMPEIPILKVIGGEALTSEIVTQLRERSSKLLDVPPVFIYFCQSMELAALPVLIAFAWSRRYLWATGGLIVWTLFYAAATAAKGPVLILAFTIGVILYSLESDANKNRLRKWVGRGFATACVFAIGLLTFREHSLFHIQISKSEVQTLNDVSRSRVQSSVPIPHFTFVDTYRVARAKDEFHHFDAVFNHLIYRTLLVPAEMSSRWFEYFPHVTGDYLGLSRTAPTTFLESPSTGPSSATATPEPAIMPPPAPAANVHAATAVSDWALRSRFPDQYRSSGRGYCSADADAWARFGYFGVVLMALLLCLIRALMYYLARDLTPAIKAAYFGALFIYATAIPAASLQAILVAQGTGAFLLFLFGAKLLSRIKSKKTPDFGHNLA